MPHSKIDVSGVVMRAEWLAFTMLFAHGGTGWFVTGHVLDIRPQKSSLCMSTSLAADGNHRPLHEQFFGCGWRPQTQLRAHLDALAAALVSEPRCRVAQAMDEP